MKPTLCLGEALIDVIHRNGAITEHIGGSPLNVACGLAALGHEISLASWWGQNTHGQAIEKQLSEARVRVVCGSDGATKTATANALIDNKGVARYEFDLEWDVPEIPAITRFGHIHTGSFAATLEPGASKVLDAIKRFSAIGTVSYDPNIRPAIMGSPELVRDRIERLISLSDVVKASEEDIHWLYGTDAQIEEILERWQKLGAALVVATLGEKGAIAKLTSEPEPLMLKALETEVADTVGAGDSFMAGLLSGLLDAGLLGSTDAKTELHKATWAEVEPTLARAITTSGITVAHHGAYSPTREELRLFDQPS